MDNYAGRPVITIQENQISDLDRAKYNSFSTRIPGAVAHEGKFRGLIGCEKSDARHEDCAFGYELDRDTSDEAMEDARRLMYELRLANET